MCERLNEVVLTTDLNLQAFEDACVIVRGDLVWEVGDDVVWRRVVLSHFETGVRDERWRIQILGLGLVRG